MLSIEIAKYLHNLGLVIFSETGTNGNTFIGNLPSTPDIAIMIRGTGGYAGYTKLPIDNPTIQILVRGTTDIRSSETLAQSIYDALHGLHSTTFITDGIPIISCQCMQSATVYLGKDGNNRHEFSLNFAIITVNENTNLRDW